MRALLRILVWLPVAMVALVLVTAIGGFAFLRTNFARDLLVARGMTYLRQIFPGGIRVGRVEGDLTRHLVLHDVCLFDREGVPAIFGERVEIDFVLAELLVRRVHVTFLGGTGVTVVSRRLRDGSDNLGSMVKRVSEPQADQPFAGLPVSIALDQLDLIDARFEWPGDQQLRGNARGQATLSRNLVLQVGDVQIDWLQPAVGWSRGRGTLELVPFAIRRATIEVDTEASQVARWLPGSRLHGPLHAVVEGRGTIGALAAKVGLAAPAFGLRATADGTVGKHALTIDRIHATAPFGTLSGSGRVAFVGLAIDAKVNTTIHDLRGLRPYGLRDLAGSLRVVGAGSVRPDHWQLQANVDGKQLAHRGYSARTLSAHVDLVDLGGDVTAQIDGFHAGQLRGATVDFKAHAAKDGVSLKLLGRTSSKVSLALALAGQPIFSAGRIVGFGAQLQTLVFQLGAYDWRSRGLAKIVVDVKQGSYAIEHLDLTSGVQSLFVDARYHDGFIERSRLNLKHFDLHALGEVLTPGQALPSTDLFAEVRAHGPLADPLVTVHFGGRADGKGSNHDIIHVSAEGDATLKHKRAIGKVFVTIGGQKVNTHFDLPIPLRPNEPISATVDASVLLSPGFAELLVPKLTKWQPLPMFFLGGLVTVSGDLRGTTSEPSFHVGGKLANWSALGAYGNLGVTVDYDAVGRALRASSKLSFSSLPAGGGQGGGVVEGTARLPFDPAGLLLGDSRLMFPAAAPFEASIKITKLAIQHLPFTALGIVPIVRSGIVNGQVSAEGTLQRPQIRAKLDGKQLDFRVIKGVDVVASAELHENGLTGDGAVTIGGLPAIRLHGALRSTAPVASIDWRRAPIELAATTRNFDLAKLGMIEGLGGHLDGQLRLLGSVAQPRGQAALSSRDLTIGKTRFLTFEASGERSGQELSAKLLATQPDGGKLDASGRVGDDGALRGELVAERLLLDLKGDQLPGIRLLRGQLDSKLTLAGTMAQPQLTGALQLQRGEVRVPSTSMAYRDLEAKVTMAASGVQIEYLRVAAGDKGKASLTGRLVMTRFRPTSLAGEIVLRQFPIMQQGFGVLVDAEVKVEGKRNAEGHLAGRVRIAKGQAQLPELQSTRMLHSTAKLADVKIVERVLPPGEAPKRVGIEIGARFEEPFLIKGKELRVMARGGLVIDLTGTEPALRGAIRLESGGWIELFGRRYGIERGRVAFERSPDPVLDVRITRSTPSATIGVDVTGSAQRPQLSFWSSPPVYDATQVAGLILSGDPGSNGVSAAGLQQQALGVVSTLIVNRLKQNLIPELPIDVLRFGTTSTQGAQIEVGKYLTEKLYVGYAYQVAEQRIGTRRLNRNEGRLSYQLGRSWQAEASFGDAGNGGLDFYWTWRPRPTKARKERGKE